MVDPHLCLSEKSKVSFKPTWPSSISDREERQGEINPHKCSDKSEGEVA